MPRFLILLILCLCILNLYISNRVYISFKEQGLLIEDFNNGTERKLKYDFIKDFEENLPNITATTLPINELKAYYLILEKEYDKAKERLYKKSKNRYLGLKESYLAELHVELENQDSVYFYRKKAFNKIPNNTRYHTTLFNLITIKERDTLILDSLFDSLRFKELITLKNYINNRSYLTPANNNYNLYLIDSLLKIYPQDDNLKEIKNIVQVTPGKYELSDKLSLEAEAYFNNNELNNAIKLYESASKLNPYKYENLESIGISYFKLMDYEKAFKYFDSVINYFDSKSGKSEFYAASILISQNKNDKACDLLKQSIEMDFKNSGKLYKAYCN